MTDNRADTIALRQHNTIIVTGIAIAFLCAPIMGAILLSKSMGDVTLMFSSRLIIWSVLPMLYLYATKIEDRRFFLWKEQFYSWWFYPASILLLYVLLFIVAGNFARIPSLFGYHDDYTILMHWNALLKKNTLLLVFVCVTAGITEEIIFRGYLLPRLSLLFKGKYTAVILSSLMFSMIHFSYKNLSEYIFTFFFGLICGVYYQKYRAITPLIYTHFLYDLSVMLMHK